MIGIILAILVAVVWSLGEVSYSKVSKKYDNTNIYLYTYFIRAILYIGIVLIFKTNMIGTFNSKVFSTVLPIIMCDLFASLVINIAVYNGKLTVVSPIMAAYPMLDIILGIFLLKEQVSILAVILAFIITLSIIILTISQTKSKKAPHPTKGVIFAIVYMLLVAFSTYFEKDIYMNSLSVYDLYYYKGMIYIIVSITFAIIILLTPIKMKKPSLDILKGCGLTPFGNILYSFALSFGNMSIVTPVSSLYSAITNFISRHYLKEKISMREKVCIYVIIISTLGLIIISQK